MVSTLMVVSLSLAVTALRRAWPLSGLVRPGRMAGIDRPRALGWCGAARSRPGASAARADARGRPGWAGLEPADPGRARDGEVGTARRHRASDKRLPGAAYGRAG